MIAMKQFGGGAFRIIDGIRLDDTTSCRVFDFCGMARAFELKYDVVRGHTVQEDQGGTKRQDGVLKPW
jgi:hypothetical protein